MGDNEFGRKFFSKLKNIEFLLLNVNLFKNIKFDYLELKVINIYLDLFYFLKNSLGTKSYIRYVQESLFGE